MRAALRHPALPRVHRRLWHDVWTPGRLGGATADASRPQLLRWHFVALHERPALSAVGGAAGEGEGEGGGEGEGEGGGEGDGEGDGDGDGAGEGAWKPYMLLEYQCGKVPQL